jgi:hypothetical protein
LFHQLEDSAWLVALADAARCAKVDAKAHLPNHVQCLPASDGSKHLLVLDTTCSACMLVLRLFGCALQERRVASFQPRLEYLALQRSVNVDSCSRALRIQRIHQLPHDVEHCWKASPAVGQPAASSNDGCAKHRLNFFMYTQASIWA